MADDARTDDRERGETDVPAGSTDPRAAADGGVTVDAGEDGAGSADPVEADDPATEGGAPEGEETDAPELVGDDLAIGYPAAEQPVVECDKVVVPEGEITALVGPNGSGKSTLLKSMANQLAPERGQVLVDGRDVESFGPKALARTLGLLSQENHAPESITVEDLVYHGRYPHRGFFDAVTDEDEAAVERALELAGVEHLRHTETGNLSGGQKQLAWIALILAQDTDVLLLDEPTTFLDLHHQLRVMEVVRTLNREEDVTIAVVLHDIGQAARFADNLIAMKDGSLYDWGPPREVVTETLLADVFQVDATVDASSPTGPHIAPHRAIEDGTAAVPTGEDGHRHREGDGHGKGDEDGDEDGDGDGHGKGDEDGDEDGDGDGHGNGHGNGEGDSAGRDGRPERRGE